MSTKAINGREVKEESSLTSDRRDFLKVAVMAAAGAALPISAASWANPAQSTQSTKPPSFLVFIVYASPLMPRKARRPRRLRWRG